MTKSQQKELESMLSNLEDYKHESDCYADEWLDELNMIHNENLKHKVCLT